LLRFRAPRWYEGVLSENGRERAARYKKKKLKEKLECSAGERLSRAREQRATKKKAKKKLKKSFIRFTFISFWWAYHVVSTGPYPCKDVKTNIASEKL
jgi:hypothetical protein